MSSERDPITERLERDWLELMREEYPPERAHDDSDIKEEDDE